jgi:peptidylprolyl isomerase
LAFQRYLAASAAALMLAACGPRDAGEPEDAPETPPEEEVTVDDEERADADALREKLAAENLAASAKFLEENAARDGVMTTESGLQYMIVEEGEEGGVTPVSTDVVVFEYSASKSDGVEFDSSRARGAAPKVPVGALNNELPGLTEGLQLMSEGDQYRFFLPPNLALGETGSFDGLIEPNEALIYEVTLVRVESPARNLEASNAFLAENAKKDGINTTESGLQYQILEEGAADGASPSATDTVKVHYAGTLINGTEFDSSYARGEPIEFPLNGVIKGWTEGVQLMSVGDKYRFFIPSELAYGERGSGPIGPNEALIFEVELIEVK